MTDTNIVDTMFSSLVRGDLPAVNECFKQEAVIWHSFDRISQSPTEAAEAWKGMIAHFPKLGISDIRRQETPSGFVQQHVWSAETTEGQRKVWEVCVVVKVENGLIARLDEYIDRAGSFQD